MGEEEAAKPVPDWLTYGVPHQQVIRDSDEWRALLEEARPLKWKTMDSKEMRWRVADLRVRHLARLQDILPADVILWPMLLWDLYQWDPPVQEVRRGNWTSPPPPDWKPDLKKLTGNNHQGG